MVIGKQDNHKDHDLAFTTLLQTARRCSVKLNYDKLKFKCTEVIFLWQNLYNRWAQTSTKQDHSYHQDISSQLQKMYSPSLEC